LLFCRLKCERQLTIVRLIKLYQCDTDGVTACDTDGVTACDTDGVMADSDTDSDRDDSADDDNSDDDNTSENLSALESAVEWFSAPAGKLYYYFAASQEAALRITPHPPACPTVCLFCAYC